MSYISKSLTGFENYLAKLITCKYEIATPLSIVSVCFPVCYMYPIVPIGNDRLLGRSDLWSDTVFCFSVTVNYSDLELMGMGITVGHAERWSHCAERTIQVINVIGPGREGHFMERWEILSTGIVKVVWNPVVWNVRVQAWLFAPHHF